MDCVLHASEVKAKINSSQKQGVIEPAQKQLFLEMSYFFQR